jgi:hypothetical protein
MFKQKREFFPAVPGDIEGSQMPDHTLARQIIAGAIGLDQTMNDVCLALACYGF